MIVILVIFFVVKHHYLGYLIPEGQNRIYKQFSEPEIIEKINAGDTKIFEALFREYYYNLCRFTAALIKSSSVAEDIVQEVFVKVWENRAKLSPVGSLKTYLYRASKNRALNYLKHLEIVNNWAEVSCEKISTKSSDPENEFLKKELFSSINDAVKKLPEKCRTIFILQRKEGLTYKEISEVLNISVNTVETQMGRALKKLRKIMFPHLSSLLIIISAVIIS